VPYLHASPQLARDWRARLRRDDKLLHVGIAWASNPSTKLGQLKSVRLEAFAPFAVTQEVMFHSLQKGPSAREATNGPLGMNLIDHDAELKSFADTAALIVNLDLVITVDTAVAHLAGALGKPVWTLVAYPSVWRWAHEGNISLWYPTMRLFRQPAPGRWDAVLQEVAEALRFLAGNRLSGKPPA
jgi:hypothetical protein